jgi:maltose O-acetyltransferase
LNREAFGLLRERRFRSLVHRTAQVLRAKWQLRHATSAGAVRLDGRAFIRNQGTMTFADRVRLDGTTVRLEFVTSPGACLSIGYDTYINYGTNISATSSVTIGDHCAIGQYSIIMDNDYHNPKDHREFGHSQPIVIEDDVWIGARVIVLKGSRIGQGSVIGANSVVNGEIPPGSLAAGSPARVLRKLREMPSGAR